MPSQRASLQVARAHTRYRDRTLAVRQSVVQRVRRQWLILPDYRDANAERFAVSASTTVTAGRAATAGLTAAFIATVATASGLQAPVSGSGLSDPRGIPSFDQWMRPAHEVWSRLADGMPVGDAIRAGENRAVTMAATDLQLAKVETLADVVQSDDRITGYQRVSGGNSCQECQGAEGEYSTDEPLAIHDNCACDGVPIFDGVRWTDLATTAPVDIETDAPVEPDHELGTRLVQV